MKKFIFLIMCLLFLLVGCNSQPTNNSELYSDNFSDSILYENIIEDYRNIVTIRMSDDFESLWNGGDVIEYSDDLNGALKAGESDIESDIHYKWSNMIIEMPAADSSESYFGYILTDINNDNSPELFWVRDDHTILAVFTVHNDNIILLDAFWARYDCVITDDGMLYTQSSGGAAIIDYEIRELTADAVLTTLSGFSMYNEVYSEYVDGEYIQIDSNKFDELIIKYPFKNSRRWLNTKITPLFNS